MPKLKYALERGEDKSLEISWKGRWKNTEVRLKGNLLGVIPTKKELRTYPKINNVVARRVLFPTKQSPKSSVLPD